MTNDTNRDFLTPQYERQVARFAEKFRTLADRIEQVGKVNIASAHPCSAAAADVVHEINSALANMPFWQLIANAADADLDRARSTAGGA